MKRNLILASLCLLAAAVNGQESYSTNVTVNSVIPDNDPSGLARGVTIAGLSGPISSVVVTLDITGGFNGDLYAYLAGPDGGFAVLLNRVGVSATSANGYGNTGFDITLDDSGSYNNMHFYQLDDPTITDGQLTGTWASDGENIDPQSSPSLFPSASPTADLTSFDTLDANGLWTLFIADVSPGGQGTLSSFGLTIVTVPEPQTWAMLAGGGMGMLILLRRRKI